MNEVLKPDLVSVVTAHMVYFCAFARSEIFPKNARKSEVGRRSQGKPNTAKVEGLSSKSPNTYSNIASYVLSFCD